MYNDLKHILQTVGISFSDSDDLSTQAEKLLLGLNGEQAEFDISTGSSVPAIAPVMSLSSNNAQLYHSWKMGQYTGSTKCYINDVLVHTFIQSQTSYNIDVAWRGNTMKFELQTDADFDLSDVAIPDLLIPFLDQSTVAKITSGQITISGAPTGYSYEAYLGGVSINLPYTISSDDYGKECVISVTCAGYNDYHVSMIVSDPNYSLFTYDFTGYTGGHAAVPIIYGSYSGSYGLCPYGFYIKGQYVNGSGNTQMTYNNEIAEWDISAYNSNSLLQIGFGGASGNTWRTSNDVNFRDLYIVPNENVLKSGHVTVNVELQSGELYTYSFNSICEFLFNLTYDQIMSGTSSTLYSSINIPTSGYYKKVKNCYVTITD